MKLNNLTLEMKNIYGLDIQNEEEVKQQIINYVMIKINEFKTSNVGSDLIFEVLNYVNLNFSFNVKNELLEIKTPFLTKYKEELIHSLNPNNFKTFTKYGEEEFYFITKDIWAILFFFSQIDENETDKEIFSHFCNFKINKKNINNQKQTILDLINIIKHKDKYLDLTDFKLLDNIFFVDRFAFNNYFLRERNTGKMKKLNAEKQAIENYFKDKNPDFSAILSFLEKDGYSKEETEALNKIFITLYNN